MSECRREFFFPSKSCGRVHHFKLCGLQWALNLAHVLEIGAEHFQFVLLLREHIAESMQPFACRRKHGRNAVKTKRQDPPVECGRTGRLLFVQVLNKPHAKLLQPHSIACHRQPSSADEFRIRCLHPSLNILLAAKVRD